jgi:hypothetical protein
VILYIGLFTEGLVLLIVEVLHSHVTELAGELGLSFRAYKIPSFYPKS